MKTQKSFFEQNSGTYTQVGDVLLPNLTIGEDGQQPIGKYKEAKKNQKIVEIKEIQLTPQIGSHDMETKARAATKFLSEGNKVKVGVRFRGRQMTHLEVGEEAMNKFIELLGDIATIEKPASMDGKWMIAILAPKKNK